MQVELVLSVEELLPTRLRRFFIKEQQTVKPNRKLNLMERIRFRIFNLGSDQFDRQEYISNALHPQQVSVVYLLIVHCLPFTCLCFLS